MSKKNNLRRILSCSSVGLASADLLIGTETPVCRQRRKETKPLFPTVKMQVFYSLFLSVELKFWFIYNIMCFPLASKITTLKVYEKNMWWIYLPISESKTTSKSRKMKSSCWKALKIRFVPRGHVRGEEIKLQCHIFCYWKDIRSRPWNVCFWWSPCYQLVQKPLWNDKLWPNKKLLKLSQHSIDLLLVMLQRKKKEKAWKNIWPSCFIPQITWIGR